MILKSLGIGLSADTTLSIFPFRTSTTAFVQTLPLPSIRRPRRIALAASEADSSQQREKESSQIATLVRISPRHVILETASQYSSSFRRKQPTKCMNLATFRIWKPKAVPIRLRSGLLESQSQYPEREGLEPVRREPDSPFPATGELLVAGN